MEKDRIIQHIRKRKDIEPHFYSVRKILEYCDVGIWSNLCCDRIADMRKIDGEHIQINWFEPGDIVMDWKGIGRASKILEEYIGEDKCDEIYELACDINDKIKEENIMLRMFRNLSRKQLIGLIKGTKENISQEEYKLVFAWLKEEKKARGIANRTTQKLKDLMTILFVKIKYYRIFKFLNNYKKYEGDIFDG